MTALFARAVMFAGCTLIGGLGVAVWFDSVAAHNRAAAALRRLLQPAP